MSVEMLCFSNVYHNISRSLQLWADCEKFRKKGINTPFTRKIYIYKLYISMILTAIFTLRKFHNVWLCNLRQFCVSLSSLPMSCPACSCIKWYNNYFFIQDIFYVFVRLAYTWIFHIFNTVNAAKAFCLYFPHSHDHHNITYPFINNWQTAVTTDNENIICVSGK